MREEDDMRGRGRGGEMLKMGERRDFEAGVGWIDEQGRGVERCIGGGEMGRGRQGREM